jgi:hypothetical protein
VRGVFWTGDISMLIKRYAEESEYIRDVLYTMYPPF